MRRLIGTDEVNGISTFHEYDHETDTTTIIHASDATPLLEQNKKMANDADYSKNGIKQGWWLYASIPAIVQTKWLIEHGVDVYNKDHGAKIGKLLNDPEYQYLKTTSGYHKFK